MVKYGAASFRCIVEVFFDIPSLSVVSKMAANINRDLRLKKVLASNPLDNDERLLTEKLKSLGTNCNWCRAELDELLCTLQVRFESSPTNLSWMIKVLHSLEIHYISQSLILQDRQTARQLVKDLTIPDETLLDIIGRNKDKELTRFSKKSASNS